MLCIHESIHQQLQLPVVEKRTGQLANGTIVEFKVVSHVKFRFKTAALCSMPWNYRLIMRCCVEQSQEGMDVLIYPQRQELIVNPYHPCFAHMKLK